MMARVRIVGCGPGGAEWVLPAARQAVAASDLVFGPADLRALFPGSPAAQADLPSRPEAAAPLVQAAMSRGLTCAVLVRGDCGMHSLAKGLQARLPEGSCQRIPGLSSVQVACALFGLEWENAPILSAHGRPLEEIDAPMLRAPVVVVLGGGASFAPVLEAARSVLVGRRLCLASDLTLPTQALRSLLPDEPVPEHLPSRTIALFARTTP